MGSLKDQLLKAGLKATPKPQMVNERPVIKKKQVTEAIIHQDERNFCEECQNVQPDVEYYQHRNPTTEAEWICLKCADRLKILDTFRKTAQSGSSIKKLFRRQYGATRPASDFVVLKSDKPKVFKDGDGNR